MGSVGGTACSQAACTRATAWHLMNSNKPFGDYFERLYEQYSNREMWRATGVNHSTIGDARAGVVPGYRTLQRIVDKGPPISAEERYELFRKAGYTMEHGTPQEKLLDWLNHYVERHGPCAFHFHGGAASLTHEEVDRLIEFYEALAAGADISQLAERADDRRH